MNKMNKKGTANRQEAVGCIKTIWIITKNNSNSLVKIQMLELTFSKMKMELNSIS